MSWVVGRINAVAPTALEHDTRIREGYAVTVSLVGFVLVWLFAAAWAVEGGVYRLLVNLAALVLVAPLLYVAWVSHVAYRRAERAASTLVLVVGVVGLGAVLVSSLLLALQGFVSMFGLEATFGRIQEVGLVVAGLWFVGTSALEHGIHLISKRVAYFGFVAGLGGIVTGVGVLHDGLANPVFMVGAALSLVGFVPWALILRRHLLAAA